MSTKVDHPDPLEASLLHSNFSDMKEEVKNYVQLMEAFEPNRRKYFESLGERSKRSTPSVKKSP